jgi:hypothetical protein
MNINTVLNEVELSLKAQFPGYVYSCIEEETGKTCFVILDRKLFFDNEELIWKIDAQFSDYADYYMIGWDWSGKYKEYITDAG